MSASATQAAINRTKTAIFYVTGSAVQQLRRAAQADCFREVGGALLRIT